MSSEYDAILIVGFGGPEKREDVIPFLENVVRGKPVPRERLLEVAEHYYHFGGVSPINAHVRELIAALRTELDAHQISLPIYWGNRNWHPLLPDTMKQMKEDNRQRAIGVVLSAYSSYSSCRQYLQDIVQAQQAVEEGAATVDKLRSFYNHPHFVAANADRVRQAFDKFNDLDGNNVHLLFTAHSIPLNMSDNCQYEQQLNETSRLVAERCGITQDRWSLVYQSRSGRPTDPWLEPDILDALRSLKDRGLKNVVIMPIGFLSDHMEVLFDLDEEARLLCEELQIRMFRAGTVGTHPLFISMLRELIQERLNPELPKQAVGRYGPNPDICPIDCCPAPARRPG
ncbi:MAG: ferrochelatase [Planctomycetaceae bacterium]